MAKIVVTLDPGHGGSDRVNRGPTGYVEADGNLYACQRLKYHLELTGKFTVHLTRERIDQGLSLTQRGVIAGKNKSELFISWHSNAFNGTMRGTRVYRSVKQPECEDLAYQFARAISSLWGIPNEGVKRRYGINCPTDDYYTVLKSARVNGVPRVFIIEAAYHDHPLDEAILKNNANLDRAAKAVADAICKYFNVKTDNTTTPKYDVPQTELPEASKTVNYPILKAGMKDNNDVRTLQTKLNKIGYKLTVDGDFGDKTRTAVLNFQRTYRLNVDGIVGPETWKALNAEVEKLENVAYQVLVDGKQVCTLKDLDNAKLEADTQIETGKGVIATVVRSTDGALLYTNEKILPKAGVAYRVKLDGVQVMALTDFYAAKNQAHTAYITKRAKSAVVERNTDRKIMYKVP